MIQFSQVSKRYAGGQEALRRISFHVDAQEMCFLTGHSGAGKSTLLKLITLVERASRGQVLVDGQNLSKLATRKIPFFTSPDWSGLSRPQVIGG